MRIGIDASPALRDAKTGIEWYTYHVLTHLIPLLKNTTVTLYADRVSQANLGAPCRVLRWPSRYFWSELRLSLEMDYAKPDVLFVPGRALPLSLPSRVVSTVHDVGYKVFGGNRSSLSTRYLDWSTQRTLTNSSRIIAISEFTKGEIVRFYGTDPEKIDVIPLGVERDHYASKPSNEQILAMRKKFSLVRPYLLTIGRIDERKNIRTLVTAFAALTDSAAIDLVVVGPMGHAGTSIAQYGSFSLGQGTLHVIPWVSEDDKRALLHGSYAFVFPSLYEGFGLPILEAQAAGVPLACSSATALGETAGTGALFFDPQSVDDMKSVLDLLVHDTDLRSRIVTAGTQNVARFSWEHTAQMTRESLERS